MTSLVGRTVRIKPKKGGGTKIVRVNTYKAKNRKIAAERAAKAWGKKSK